MSLEHLSRNDRRRMQKLQPLVDRAINSDRLVFQRHPDRAYRIRRAHSAKVLQKNVIQGAPLAPLPGCKIFVIVKCLSAGSRLRILMQGPADFEVDLPENEAAAAYEEMAAMTPKIREVEAELREVSCKEAS